MTDANYADGIVSRALATVKRVVGSVAAASAKDVDKQHRHGSTFATTAGRMFTSNGRNLRDVVCVTANH